MWPLPAMVRFVCDEIVSRLSDAVWDAALDSSRADILHALRVLCSREYACECSCASSGTPSTLRILTVCALAAVSEELRRPSFARLTEMSAAADTVESCCLLQALSCLLRPAHALLLSAPAAGDACCYYLCYVADGDVCVEQLAVDAVSESTRLCAAGQHSLAVAADGADPPSYRHSVSSPLAALASSTGAATASSTRASRRKPRPAVQQQCGVSDSERGAAHSRRRVKQSERLLQSLRTKRRE